MRTLTLIGSLVGALLVTATAQERIDRALALADGC
jgi:hypothetical protein